jgi:hypothetical protein
MLIRFCWALSATSTCLPGINYALLGLPFCQCYNEGKSEESHADDTYHEVFWRKRRSSSTDPHLGRAGWWARLTTKRYYLACPAHERKSPTPIHIDRGSNIQSGDFGELLHTVIGWRKSTTLANGSPKSFFLKIRHPQTTSVSSHPIGFREQ